MTELLRRLYSEQVQSPWLDNLQRGYLTSGVLADLVKSGVRGLTSNPTIFQKAIQGSSDYDEQFAEELSKGRQPLECNDQDSCNSGRNSSDSRNDCRGTKRKCDAHLQFVEISRRYGRIYRRA